MGSEKRTVRPYVGLGAIGRSLDHVRLVVGGEKVEKGGRVSIPASTYLVAPVTLRLAGSVEGPGLCERLLAGLEAAEIDPAAVELVVMLTNPQLKRTSIVFQHSLEYATDLPADLELATPVSRPDPFRSPFAGCVVDVYVLLAREHTPTPLRPWRRGTWLARASFKVTTELGDVGFSPIPLTDVERQALGLPAGTLRFVEIDDPLGSPEGMRVYVDDELLVYMSRSANSPGARALQTQLFLDAMTALVYEASRSDDLEGIVIDEVEETLLGGLLRMLVPGSGADSRDQREMYLKRIRVEPRGVIASIEARLPKLKRSLTDSITGGVA